MCACSAVLLLTTVSVFAADDAGDSLPAIAEHTTGMQRQAGFFPFFKDAQNGSVLAEIATDGEPFLYASGLSSGLGSNPVGLDRGQWGQTRLCVFKRVGKRVYLIEQNTAFRASSNNTAERRAVEDSFADSIFWATDVVAETDDRVLIDLHSLLVRDAHQVVSTLRRTDQGDYQFDESLSYVELDRCKAFPRNSELNAMVTFKSARGGALVQQTAADGRSFSVRLHHSFVQLPPPGYRPRKADPRVASFAVTFADYSAPLDAPLEQRYIARHRLQKADPAAAQSPAVEPIIYYLDPGTPAPVRSALLEGARWWNDAFAAAGYLDAFQVRMLPEDVDPMDVRYNVISWVHRRTRGWSYGQSITDPRTGEIIKGHVLLGSLRVRQDRLIIDGLTDAASVQDPVTACGIAGRGVSADRALAMFDDVLSPVEVSLARLRQLSAHEVGHTIGFSHNFAASTWGDRASVMDYPAPRVTIRDDGTFDLSDAYGVGIGAWDTFMVRYAYSEFPDQSEEQGLQALLQEAEERNLLYLSDADARPAGAAHPRANLWDNGTDPVAELQHLMKVREVALNKLSEGDLLPGQNLADLETVLVPIYLYHRYQVEAVAKMIGGFDYDYAVAGQQRRPLVAIAAPAQQAALQALIRTLYPQQLELRPELLAQLPPRPHSSAVDRERFAGRTAMIFDPDAAVRTAAEMTLSQILHPQRAARLAAYGDDAWNLDTMLNQLVGGIFVKHTNRHINRIVEHTLVRKLIALAGDESTSHAVRQSATQALERMPQAFRRNREADQQPHYQLLLSEIRRFQDRPHETAKPPERQTPPPGSPIGDR